MTTQGSPERTLGQLVADATHDLSTIVRSEIELAKTEITTEAKTAGKSAAMFGAAAFVGLLGVIFLFHTWPASRPRRHGRRRRRRRG